MAQFIANGLSISEAGRLAGYSPKTCKGQIYRIAKHPFVVECIEKLQPVSTNHQSIQPSNQTNAFIPFTPQLEDYVRALRSTPDTPFILDAWQIDLCRRLELHFWLAHARKFKFATEGNFLVAPSGFKIEESDFDAKRQVGTKVAIHAFPQAGKSIIISNLYLSWILGQDPFHRIRLATYGVNHSKRFSGAIRRSLESISHRRFFPNPAGYVNRRARADEWSTAARIQVNDSQPSFIALGLESGFTGSGVDTLVMDDPYPSAHAALSQKTRDNVWSFWIDTAKVRCHGSSNVFLMFHRYHQDDQAGRAILHDNFDLWRYAAQEDGEYEEPESGKKFQSPFPRQDGEYLSNRWTKEWYEEHKRSPDVWSSQFQGRPAPKGGSMFDTTKLQYCRPSEVPELLFRVRAWDNAATQDDGAWSVGWGGGIDAAGNIYVFDLQRKQVNTADREALQKQTARVDGKLVAIHAPQDPGAAGKDVAFWFREEFKHYEVQTDPVSKSKEQRAYNYSIDWNKAKVFVIYADEKETPPDWLRTFLNEHDHFPHSTYKDIVDAGSDGHKFLTDKFKHGRVIKGVTEDNMLGWDRFAQMFGWKIPAHWDVTVGMRVQTDRTQPSAYTILARAADNARLGEVVFVVASRKMHVSDAREVFTALTSDLNHYCTGGVSQPSAFYTVKGNGEIIQLAYEKYGMSVQEFAEDENAGLLETGWYFQKTKAPNPFYYGEQPPHAFSHCYLLVDPAQVSEAIDEDGQLSLRQDLVFWSFNTKGKPQPEGGVVLNTARIQLYNFALTATALTPEERREMCLPEHLQKEALLAKLGTEEFVTAYWERRNAEKIMVQEEKARTHSEHIPIGGRMVIRKRYQRPRR